VPPHVPVKYKTIVDNVGANLKILGPEYPELIADLDPVRINAERIAMYRALQFFFDDGIAKSGVHWCVVAAATPSWGKKIFPKAAPAEAQALLWEEIFKICRVDRPDFMDAWKRHNALLQERALRLTELRIAELHFAGPGTDLRVGLSDRYQFKGGSDVSPRGVTFEPNLPTEECFTTPDWRKTQGKARATRPFLVNGKLIQGLELEFRDGEIVRFSAREGEATFREYIESDAGGKRLGEVALVGIDSPIFRSGLVFEEILFDENAACHIAVGSAYKFCLRGGTELSKAELDAIGCNESSVHTDMMITSPEVDVHATLRSGEIVTLLEKGSWKKF
jgi:aminopeptidase